MKRIFILALSVLPAVANAQKDTWYIGLQVQPEVSFHKSQYPFVSATTHARSSFNTGFTLHGQYLATNRLFVTLGLGFIARKLNTSEGIDKPRLPAPYADYTGPFQVTRTVSSRLLQIPVGLGYNFLQTKKTTLSASLLFIPNFLINTKYGSSPVDPYPAFKKNYWQGISVNPSVGIDYALSGKIKLTGALAYSIINTVREEEYANRQPRLTHSYLQLGAGVKLKLK